MEKAFDVLLERAYKGQVGKSSFLFRDINVDELPQRDQLAYHRMKKIYIKHDVSIETGDIFLDKVIIAYRRYWLYGLSRSRLPVAVRFLFGEVLLRISLKKIAKQNVTINASIGKIYGFRSKYAKILSGKEQFKIAQLLSTSGYNSLQGISLPYRELLLWKSEKLANYTVTLPEREINITVAFLSDFICTGWLDFATGGKTKTGGWVENGLICCINDSYDTNSEEFSISLLTHESQHISDIEKYPELKQPELEYRAKLAELSLSKITTYDLINRYLSSICKKRELPHQYANYCAIRDICKKLNVEYENRDEIKTKSIREINEAAYFLLLHNTKKIEMTGGSKCKRTLRA